MTLKRSFLYIGILMLFSGCVTLAEYDALQIQVDKNERKIKQAEVQRFKAYGRAGGRHKGVRQRITRNEYDIKRIFQKLKVLDSMSHSPSRRSIEAFERRMKEIDEE